MISKKSASLIAIALSLSTNAWATPQDDAIAKIQGLYDSAQLPSAEILRGIWDGRCFPYSEDESPVEGALLIGNDLKSVGGPLFDSAGSVNFRVAYGQPAQFDQFNPELSALPASEETYSDEAATVAEDSYRLQAGTWGGWTSVWNVRWLASKGYVIALQYAVRSEGDTAVPLGLNRACYFFKRLR